MNTSPVFNAVENQLINKIRETNESGLISAIKMESILLWVATAFTIIVTIGVAVETRSLNFTGIAFFCSMFVVGYVGLLRERCRLVLLVKKLLVTQKPL